MGFGSKTTQQDSSMRPVFDSPEAKQLLGRLSSQFGGDMQGQEVDFLTRLLSQPMDRPSPMAQQLVDETSQLGRRDLRDNLALVQGQLRGTPMGRSQLAMGEVGSRAAQDMNKFRTETLLGQQNLGIEQQMHGAQALGGLRGQHSAGGLGLLEMLRGQDTTGTATQPGDKGGAMLGILGALGGLMTGGAALIPALSAAGVGTGGAAIGAAAGLGSAARGAQSTGARYALRTDPNRQVF